MVDLDKNKRECLSRILFSNATSCPPLRNQAIKLTPQVCLPTPVNSRMCEPSDGVEGNMIELSLAACRTPAGEEVLSDGRGVVVGGC
jgi:hypothetical protein